MDYLIVFFGGGVGAALRHAVNRASLTWLGVDFPGTMFVNVLGSLFMGVLAQFLLGRSGEMQEWRLFLATGVLGGFTTFSAFSLDAAGMWQRGDYLTCAAYAVGSVLLSIAALLAGMAAVRAAYSG